MLVNWSHCLLPSDKSDAVHVVQPGLLKLTTFLCIHRALEFHLRQLNKRMSGCVLRLGGSEAGLVSESSSHILLLHKSTSDGSLSASSDGARQ